MLRAELGRWITDVALPLWSGAGFDARTGTVWEELDHHGKPLSDMTKRLRVQARQAFCFALAGPRYLPAANQLFRFVMDKGFDPHTGNLGSTLSPDGAILTARHDLYDLAFVMLAASALHDAGIDVASDLVTLGQALARLKAPQGWHQNAARTLPRGQNPHMHLFEAATMLFAATGLPQFGHIADECLMLFRDRFFQPDGRIAEHFTSDLTPVPAMDQITEPGHMAEWVYLLDQYERVFGVSTAVNLTLLFEATLARRDAAGFLPDTSDPASKTRRLWPQTELLKAAVVMQRRGAALPATAHPDAILDRLWHDYMVTPTPGGWFDKRDRDGALLSSSMPASTFYHLLVAFRALDR